MSRAEIGGYGIAHDVDYSFWASVSPTLQTLMLALEPRKSSAVNLASPI